MRLISQLSDISATGFYFLHLQSFAIACTTGSKVNLSLLATGLLFSHLSWTLLTLPIDLETCLEIYWVTQELGVLPKIIW